MSTLAELIEEGKRLEKAATKGPWRINPAPGHPTNDGVCGSNGDWVAVSGKADAALIAFARTALPRLLAVAEAGAKMRKTLDVLEYAGTSPRLSADIAAFDAAASGEARG